MNTVTFKFTQTGFNAHTAEGTFTYRTPEQAQQAAERLRKTRGYTNVKVSQPHKKTNSQTVYIRIPKIHKKLVLLQYDNCGPSVQIVTSTQPLTLDRIADYFKRVDGADWERDSLTILGDGKIAELSIDTKRLR